MSWIDAAVGTAAAGKQTFPVSSSFITEVIFDPDTGVMTVNMKSGKTYEYPDYTIEKALALVRAPSPGRWFNEKVKVS